MRDRRIMHKLFFVIFLLFLMYPVAADQITIRDADYTVNSTLTNPLSLNQTKVPTMVKVRYADVGYKTDLEKPIVNQTTLPTMIKVRHADASYRSGIEKPLVEQTTLPTMIKVRHADASYRSGIEKPLVVQTTLPTMIKVRYADASYRSGLEEPAVNQTTLPTMIKVRHADVIFRSDLSEGLDLSDLPGDQDSTGPTPGNAEILEFSHTTGTVKPWSQGAAVVVISNTGTTNRSFWVGLSYKKQGASEWIDIDPQQSIDIYPGGSANVQFSWTLTDEAGTYDIFTKIWDGYGASTDQMIPPSYDEQIDIDAFIISDQLSVTPELWSDSMQLDREGETVTLDAKVFGRQNVNVGESEIYTILLSIDYSDISSVNRAVHGVPCFETGEVAVAYDDDACRLGNVEILYFNEWRQRWEIPEEIPSDREVWDATANILIGKAIPLWDIANLLQLIFDTSDHQLTLSEEFYNENDYDVLVVPFAKVYHGLATEQQYPIKIKVTVPLTFEKADRFNLALYFAGEIYHGSSFEISAPGRTIVIS